MRKILSFVIVAAVVAYFVACSVDEDYNPNYQKPILKNSYVVSIPQAIDRLNAMFPNSVTVTRSRVSEVITLSRKDFGLVTRSSTAADAPLIYIIPTDDNGCAVMGADSRMTPLYALLENTILTAEDFLNFDTRADSVDSQEGDSEIREFVAGLLYDAATADYLEFPSIPWDSTRPELDIELSPIIKSIDSLTESHQAYLATKWSQNQSPYNSNLPDSLNGVAGCVTIAVAQIVYHNRFPQTIGMTTFNWDKISTFEYGNTSYPKYPNDVANFIRRIINEFNPTPTETGTSINFLDAYEFFNNFYTTAGYFVTPMYYDEQSIKHMITQQNPVLVSGKQLDVDSIAGHAWVIDGYRRYEEYAHNLHTNEIYKVDSLYRYYFHCNFGWKGVCDGYYLSRTFDVSEALKPKYVEGSIGDKRGKIINGNSVFSAKLKMIFYEKEEGL